MFDPVPGSFCAGVQVFNFDGIYGRLERYLFSSYWLPPKKTTTAFIQKAIDGTGRFRNAVRYYFLFFSLVIKQKKQKFKLSQKAHLCCFTPYRGVQRKTNISLT